MKKFNKALIVLVFVLLATVILTACNGGNNNGGNNNDGGQAPVYLGMDIKESLSAVNTSVLRAGQDGNSQGGNDNNQGGNKKGDLTDRDATVDQDEPFEEIDNPVTVEEKIESTLEILTTDRIEYYAEQNQDIFIVVRFLNPDNYVIVSFNFNGARYASYMFQDGSTMESIILKVNAGELAGVVSYTIDEIKYIDGSDIKDVIIDGNKTVKVGVRTNNQTTVQISNEEIGLDGISFTAYLTDTYNLIGLSDGFAKAVLYNGREIVAEKELETGENEVVFGNLNPNTKYQYAIFGYYDNLTGSPAGASMNLMKKKAFFTKTVVLFDADSITIGQENVSFGFVWDESVTDKTITGIELIHGNTKTTLTGNSADGLLSNNEYTVEASYKNLKNQTESISFTFTTLAKAVPTLSITNVVPTQEEISFNLNITDTDAVGSLTAIELYKGSQKVKELATLTDREFTALLSNNAYQIKVTYTYDLNDGEEAQILTETYDVTTLAKAVPTLSITNVVPTQEEIAFDLSITDTDGVGSLTAIELYKGSQKVAELTTLTDRIFTGLDDYTAYQIKITYTYNLNDGEDDRELEKTFDTHTLANVLITSASLANTSAVSIGETIYAQANLQNPNNVTITKVQINGKIYLTMNASTATRLFVEFEVDEDFEGGDTDIIFEKLYYAISGVEYSIEIMTNNEANIFVNGELTLIAFSIVNENLDEIEFAVVNDKLYYLLTLSNATGYDVINITFGGSYGDEEWTIIDKENILMPIKRYYDSNSGWFAGDVLYSITYQNENITKTKILNNIQPQNAVYRQESDTPIAVSTADDLKNMNGGKYYVLQNDIDLAGQEWQPNEFEGVFDGNGYSIKNMTIATTFFDTDIKLGLFSTASGVINNLTIKDTLFLITLDRTNNTTYPAYIGVIAGVADKLIITNVKEIDGMISIVNYCGGVISGGLVGSVNYAKITESSSSVNISATDASMPNWNGWYTTTAGGLVGNGGVVYFTECFTNGNMKAESRHAATAGGLVASGSTIIVDRCYTTGSMSSYSEMYASSGGIAGGGMVGFEKVVITNSYTTSDISSNKLAGGLIGNASRIEIVSSYTRGNVDSDGNAGGFIGIVDYSSTGFVIIISSYVVGNISSINAAGDLIGQNIVTPLTASNCYVSDTQIVDVENCNSNADSTSLSNLKSRQWIIDNLGWSEDIWLLVDGEFPILKTIA